MSSSVATGTLPAFRMPRGYWAVIAVIAGLGAWVFADALWLLYDAWTTRPEYSHGLVIPLLSAFLVWQRQRELERLEFDGSWWGLLLVALGLLLHFVGKLAALYVVQQYALMVVVCGAVLSLAGFAVVRRVWMPLLVLALAIPLPAFVLGNLSAELQLVSSRIGVWVIRLFGISVHLEGNVIDLGTYRLQVAEACDGLRYLFPLMTLGAVMAYFFRAAAWKRCLVFVSSIPITILMNSFRIGVIGVTVEHWGVRMAEGFLHEFQGWVVFMASAALMLLLMAMLSRTGRERRPWHEAFAIEFPAAAPAGLERHDRRVPAPLYAVAALIAGYALVMALTPSRVESVPARPPFVDFPMRLDEWSGRADALEPVYLEALDLGDYLLADYGRGGQPGVNLYVAWYDSQRSGQSAHSPRSCLPGGGWQIDEMSTVALPVVTGDGDPLRVNRVLIRLGNQRQLVYYWFQQRGRIVTNEYLVKWYLLVDSLQLNRTDGALVRLTTPLAAGEDVTAADRRLGEFAARAMPELERFVPR